MKSDDLWVVTCAVGVTAMSRIVTPTGVDKPLLLRGRRVPTLCLVRRLTGHRCPSCGLSRGVVYLLRGDVQRSISSHPLTPLVVALGVARAGIAVYRIGQALRHAS